MSEIDKLNYNFSCGQVLLAESLNGLKNKINDIIDYLSDFSNNEIDLSNFVTCLSSYSGGKTGDIFISGDNEFYFKSNNGWKKLKSGGVYYGEDMTHSNLYNLRISPSTNNIYVETGTNPILILHGPIHRYNTDRFVWVDQNNNQKTGNDVSFELDKSWIGIPKVSGESAVTKNSELLIGVKINRYGEIEDYNKIKLSDLIELINSNNVSLAYIEWKLPEYNVRLTSGNTYLFEYSQVIAHYTDGSLKDVSDLADFNVVNGTGTSYNFSRNSSLTANGEGTIFIIASYDGKIASEQFTCVVGARRLEKLIWANAGISSTSFNSSENPYLTGNLGLYYSDGTIEPITSVEASYFNINGNSSYFYKGNNRIYINTSVLEPGTYSVTAQYNNLTAKKNPSSDDDAIVTFNFNNDQSDDNYYYWYVGGSMPVSYTNNLTGWNKLEKSKLTQEITKTVNPGSEGYIWCAFPSDWNYEIRELNDFIINFAYLNNDIKNSIEGYTIYKIKSDSDVWKFNFSKNN